MISTPCQGPETSTSCCSERCQGTGQNEKMVLCVTEHLSQRHSCCQDMGEERKEERKLGNKFTELSYCCKMQLTGAPFAAAINKHQSNHIYWSTSVPANQESQLIYLKKNTYVQKHCMCFKKKWSWLIGWFYQLHFYNYFIILSAKFHYNMQTWSNSQIMVPKCKFFKGTPRTSLCSAW